MKRTAVLMFWLALLALVASACTASANEQPQNSQTDPSTIIVYKSPT